MAGCIVRIVVSSYTVWPHWSYLIPGDCIIKFKQLFTVLSVEVLTTIWLLQDGIWPQKLFLYQNPSICFCHFLEIPFASICSQLYHISCLCLSCRLHNSQDGRVSTVTILQAAHLWNDGSILRRTREFSLLKIIHTSSRAHTLSSSPSTWLLPRDTVATAWSWPLIFHLVLRLRMSVAMPLTPLRVFMVCTGTIWPL